jgi:hypothetical protein
LSVSFLNHVAVVRFLELAGFIVFFGDLDPKDPLRSNHELKALPDFILKCKHWFF